MIPSTAFGLWLAGPLLLAGCLGTGPPEPADLRFGVRWQPWHDDPLPHLILSLTNRGGTPINLGPGGEAVEVVGPPGFVPLYWGDTPFARPVLAHQTVFVALHPRLNESGAFGLAIDHAWGIPSPPPVGLYSVCIQGECEAAELAT